VYFRALRLEAMSSVESGMAGQNAVGETGRTRISEA